MGFFLDRDPSVNPLQLLRVMPAVRLRWLANLSLVALAGAACLVAAPRALAQSLRCNGDLASIGDSKASVLQKCGEPLLKDQFCRPVTESASSRSDGGSGSGSSSANITINACQPVDEWTYNPGYGQFMTMLQFESGELKRIRYGDRVTR